MARHCVDAGCSGKVYSFHKFPRNEALCEEGGLAPPSSKEATGMAHWQTLSCAPSILQGTAL